MSQCKFMHRFEILSAILISMALLAACGAKSAVVGKWEVVSGNYIGTLYEFSRDGTLSVGDYAGKYTWPDQTHLQLDYGSPIVYGFALSRGELTLTDLSSQSTIVLKKYQEFNLSQEAVAGTWERSSPDSSGCFKGLGVETTPQELVLGGGGTITIHDNVDAGTTGSSLLMQGQYVISGRSLHVIATGLLGNSGFVGTGPSQTQPQGEFICNASVSNSRLTFTNAQGQNTLFVRAGQ